jgi:hypothetical protein
VSRVLRPRSGLGQGLFNDRLPEYVDLLVAEDPRSQGEAEFVGSLRHALNDALRAESAWVKQVSANFANTGYRILIVDRDSRPRFIGFSYDEAIALGEGANTEKGMFDRIVGLCIQKWRTLNAPVAAEGISIGPA